MSKTNQEANQSPQSSPGLSVDQAFLVNATTLPGLLVSQTNLAEATIKGKGIKMVLVEGGLAVSGLAEDKKTILKFFIPSSNIKSCKLT